MPEDKGRRVLGPYTHRDGFTLVVFGAAGARSSRKFATKREAEQAKAILEAEIQKQKGLTLEDALAGYLEHLKDRGLKSGTVTTAEYRLRAFLGDTEKPLSFVTPAYCEELYLALKGRSSVDTHRNTLSVAKTFFKWCTTKGFFGARKESPAEGVEPTGRRSRGKPQLRISEARKWEARALERAQEGKEGAIAALCALYLALRASEIVGLKVRDLDDDGHILWVEGSEIDERGRLIKTDETKTVASQRRLFVPETLRPFLVRLIEGKAPSAPIFGDKKPRRREWVRDWVRQICREAEVPEVCAHSMRGLHATLAEAAGATSLAVSQALGHEVKAPEVTHAHYTQPAAADLARQESFLRVLEGGKK